MQSNKLPHEKALALYEQRVSFVRTVLNHDPSLLNVFNDEERSAFEKYFLPDWTEVGNFVHYYENLKKEDPVLMNRADELLKKFLERNDLDKAELLLPQ